jgi:uncharacterized protein (DUF885 family)
MKAILAVAAAALALPLQAAEPAPNKALHALFDREFRVSLEEFPERATALGMDGFDDRLTDRSPKAIARRKAHTREVIAELERFEPKNLATQDRISRNVMLANLRLDAEENALFGELPFGANDSFQPVTSTGGPHSFLVYATKSMRFRTAKDYDNYLKRHAAVPRMVDEVIAIMREGMRTGWMPPAEAMTRATAQFAVFAAPDVKATPLWRPFEQFPRDVAEADRARLAREGEQVLSTKVHPAFASLKRFVEAEYLPHARKTLGATTLPKGERYYELRVREMTTTTMKAEEIHQLGLAEVARIRGAMDKVMAEAGFKGTFEEFVKFLNTDARFLPFTKPE